MCEDVRCCVIAGIAATAQDLEFSTKIAEKVDTLADEVYAFASAFPVWFSNLHK